jgi:hypothetical protein
MNWKVNQRKRAFRQLQRGSVLPQLAYGSPGSFLCQKCLSKDTGREGCALFHVFKKLVLLSQLFLKNDDFIPAI